MCHLNPSGSENELNSGIGRFGAYPKKRIENWVDYVMMHWTMSPSKKICL